MRLERCIVGVAPGRLWVDLVVNKRNLVALKAR
jgi:hypothetical protein